MSAKTDTDYLLDMLGHAEHAVAFVEGRSYADLASDREFNFALQHCFLVIGEAASHVSEATRCRLPGIAWKQIIGMRQWVVHRYDRVDDKVLWKTVTEDLPDLITKILEFLPPEQT
jgi:uncharacterized protein with HEPN domain